MLTDQAPVRTVGEHSPQFVKQTISGRSGEAYTVVVGKGGLVREIRLSGQLAKEPERTRLSEPRIVVDRGIKYSQHYNLSGGVYFSFIFGKTSKEVLGWSTGHTG